MSEDAAASASTDSPGEQALALELDRAERQLQDANLNNEALVRVIHQMQLEQEALERKWQRERLGREVIERNWQRERGNSLGSIAAVDLAAEADARVAAREAAHVLQRQASLLLATQEHRMQLMTLRLDTMHEQLDAICPRAHVLAGDEPVLPPAEGEAPLQVEPSSSVAEWAECMAGGLCLESASLWIAPEGAGSVGVGVHGRRAAISTVAWSGSGGRLVDDLTAWWAVSPERRAQWWAGRTAAPTLPGCAWPPRLLRPARLPARLAISRHLPPSHAAVPPQFIRLSFVWRLPTASLPYRTTPRSCSRSLTTAARAPPLPDGSGAPPTSSAPTRTTNVRRCGGTPAVPRAAARPR